MEKIYNKVYYPEYITRDNTVFIPGNYYQAKPMIDAIRKKFPGKPVVNLDSLKDPYMRRTVKDAIKTHYPQVYLKYGKIDVNEIWKNDPAGVCGCILVDLFEEVPDAIFYGQNLQKVMWNYVYTDGEEWNIGIVICNFVKYRKEYFEEFGEEYIKNGGIVVSYKDEIDELNNSASTNIFDVIDNLDIENKVFLPKCLVSNKIDAVHKKHVLIIANEKDAEQIADLLIKKCKNSYLKNKYPFYTTKDFSKYISIVDNLDSVKNILRKHGLENDGPDGKPTDSSYIKAFKEDIKISNYPEYIYNEISMYIYDNDKYSGIIYGDYKNIYYAMQHLFVWNYSAVIVGHLPFSQKMDIEDEFKDYLKRCIKAHQELTNYDIYCDLDYLIKKLKKSQDLSKDTVFESYEDFKSIYESLIGLEGLLDDEIY